MIRVLLLAVVLGVLVPAGAQQPYFRHYGMEQGLSNNKVICALQDSLGFLWFGTRDGLNRFDGYHFKIFRNRPGDTTSIGNNYIQSLQFIPGIGLLAGTRQGIYRFDGTTETFERLVKQETGSVSNIAATKDGDLWYISEKRLKRFSVKTGDITVFGNLQLPEPTAVCTLADGSIWVASEIGNIYQFQPGNNSFTAYNLFQHSRKAASSRIVTLFGTADTTLLVGTVNQGAKHFSPKTKTYQDLLGFASDNTELYVRDFLQISRKEYWIATEKGIFIYNTETKKYQQLQKGFSNPYSLSDNSIYTLCKDNEGGIWAGTNFGGLNYFPRQYTPFQRFFPGSMEHALSGNVVHDITGDRLGNIWIGTEDAGLNKWNPATGKVTYYQPGTGKNGIAYSNVHGLLAVGNELWVGTYEHGLDVLDIRTGQVLRHYTSGSAPNQFSSNFIVTIYQTKSGEILIGTWNGLFRYRRKTDDFELFQDFTGQVQSLGEGLDGTLWICTLDNGIYFIKKDGTRGNLRYHEGREGLASNTVHGQYHDPQGYVWFATENGLSRFQPQTDQFKHYTTRQGMPDNTVYRIEADRDGKLWTTTTNGIASLDLYNGQIRTYTTANGLLSNHFNFNSSFQDGEGRIYFGSVKGLISFNPATFLRETFKPPLFFTQVRINDGKEENKTVAHGAPLMLHGQKTLVLQHNQSTLSIDFAALSFTAPEMTEYRYKMIGLESDWTLLKTARTLYFSALRPGSYTLQLQALDPSGYGVLAQKELHITIEPPWWASSWAYLGYFMLTITLIWMALHKYHQATRKRALRKVELMSLQKEKELYAAKLDFFTNVAHEIRTPLTLIKGPLERVRRKVGELPDLRNSLRIMERNTERLIELTGQLLDFQKAEARGFRIQFQTTNISELLEDHFANAKAMAEDKAMDCSLHMPANALLTGADTEALNKIFANLLNNAVKYAEKRLVVRLEPAQPDPAHFSIYVENDGPLIPEGMQEKIFEPFFRLPKDARIPGSGVGLALARSLAMLHGGSLELVLHHQHNIFRLVLAYNHSAHLVQKTVSIDQQNEINRAPMV
ncbi:two-component regulator propeller domain-containing protein [Pseudocnuella soli]|uniref:two-component regulator propeller domain-containing protein n=1 Tax=Pseudocnuella soli TaxID=2502779 RepID=UPI001042D20D|nr:two-component regulator propeller domain-containing protein [Pseudocnuella soli]